MLRNTPRLVHINSLCANPVATFGRETSPASQQPESLEYPDDNFAGKVGRETRKNLVALGKRRMIAVLNDAIAHFSMSKIEVWKISMKIWKKKRHNLSD